MVIDYIAGVIQVVMFASQLLDRRLDEELVKALP
jgi:hypothetical protein